jgi:uncharacterized lipoprotein YajG
MNQEGLMLSKKMERRKFTQRLFEVFTLGGLFLLVGCKAKEKSTAFGNQENSGNWLAVSRKQKNLWS